MVTIYFGDELSRYGFGDAHPFGPDRIYAFWKQTVEQGLDKQVEIAAPVRCDENAPTRFHSPDYVERVRKQSETGRGFLDYGDTPAFKGVFEAASYVVGTGLDGIERIINEDRRRVFVPIAGLHHARREQAGGFCVFNDVGIVIETLREKFAIQRIAYVDIDAHHGDGVFYAFEHDPDLIFADIHEDGRFLFPGTGCAEENGTGAAEGTKLNIPVLPNSDDGVFFKHWPRIEEFVKAGKPEFVLLQAGADSIAGDPITHMAFTPRAHRHAAQRLCRLADEFCNGRFIAMGGGGYNRRNLAAGWNEVVRAMLAA
ncbi:MAG: Acetoin utilization protein AcuC [Gammaproteobacteria bacterium]|nr:Acetoin utilization protein AcuC [Gammaproteobacteria bacterium]